MALTLFGVAANPADNGSNSTDPVAVTPPASMVAGDLVVVEVSEDSGLRTITISDAGGQSWTSETNINNVGRTVRVFWCVFNGTWSADPSFDFSVTASCYSAVMLVFRGNGAGYTWRQDVAYDIDTFTATTATRLGVVTVETDVVAVAGWGNVFERTWGSLSGAGWTVAGDAQYRNLAGNDQTLSYAYYVATAPATDTGDVSKTANASTTGATWIMAWANIEVKAALAMHHYRQRRAA